MQKSTGDKGAPAQRILKDALGRKIIANNLLLDKNMI